MMEYPGSPFTGIILNDLVMFFLIPTIFIILVIYMAVGRVVAGHPGLRLLVGLGAYLFIIFGGYFGVFARIAGPYFIFLIFVLGLLYFLLEHFSRRGGYSSGGGYSGGGGGFQEQSRSGSKFSYAHLENMSWQELNVHKDRLKETVKYYGEAVSKAKDDTKKGDLLRQEADAKAELRETEKQLNIVAKSGRKFGLG